MILARGNPNEEREPFEYFFDLGHYYLLLSDRLHAVLTPLDNDVLKCAGGVGERACEKSVA